MVEMARAMTFTSKVPFPVGRALLSQGLAYLVALLPVLVILALLVAPIAMWSRGVLREAPILQYFTLARVYAVRTVLMSLTVAVLATVLAAAAALQCLYGTKRERNWIAFAMSLPLLVGFLARNYSWLGLLSWMSDATPGDRFDLIYSRAGVVLVMTTVFVPFAFFVILQGIHALTPDSLNAATVLGASPTRVLRGVVAPVVGRSVLVAVGLTTVLAVGYFITPRMIGGGTVNFLGNQALAFSNDLGASHGAALAFYLILISVLPLLPLVTYVARRRARLMPDRE